MRGSAERLLRRAIAVAALVFALGPAAGARALTLDPVGDFSAPVYVTSEPDEDRLLIVERAGTVILSENGAESTFLDLTGGLIDADGEGGLFSIALDPDYASNGRLYAFYTRAGTPSEPGLAGDIQVDEFTAAGGSVDLATRRPLLTIDHPTYDNHFGGQLQFGPDGMLYISTGDGGGDGDPGDNAQDTESLLGKILRIDPDDPPGPDQYTVPDDNPFVGVAGADEIWSLGLRNPWRFSFDRLTGDLLIGDVGQERWEEIDFGAAPDAGKGANFGWDACEGNHLYVPLGTTDPCLFAQAAPLFEYEHVLNDLCSVTGGYVVRDPGLTELAGRYVYADFCGPDLHSITLTSGVASDPRTESATPDLPDLQLPTSFGEDSCGRLYVTSLLDGIVYRLTDETPTDCSASPDPEPEPEPVTPLCAGEQATVIAERGALTRGTNDDDVVVGSAAADRLRGRGGDDLICGARGADKIKGGGGDDVIRGGPGKDRCDGGPGRDRVSGCSKR